MRKVVLGLITILIALPIYAINRDLQIRGIDALKNAGICTTVKVSKGGPYCIVDCKKIHGKEVCVDIARKECKWTVENYAEGSFLKPGQIDSIVIVNDECAAHAGGFGETVFITGLKAKIFPYKLGDQINFLAVLKGKDGRDRLLMTSESYHQGYYFGRILVCNFTSLQKDLYDICKDIEGLEDVKTFTDEGYTEFKIAIVPVRSESDNYLFEIRLQKLINERPVASKRCSLKYQWDGVKLISSAENKKCLEAVKRFLPKADIN